MWAAGDVQSIHQNTVDCLHEHAGLPTFALRDGYVSLYALEYATLGVQTELHDISHPGAVVAGRVGLVEISHKRSATGKLQISPVYQLLQVLAESVGVLDG